MTSPLTLAALRLPTAVLAVSTTSSGRASAAPAAAPRAAAEPPGAGYAGSEPP